MRRAAVLFLALPLLAACDSGTPPAAEAPVKTAAVTATDVANTTAQGAVPAGARALIGTWSATPGQCSEPAATTVIAATSFAAGGQSCDITLVGNKDGSYSATCGGEQIAMIPIFAPSGEGLHLTREGQKSTVYRCKR